MSTAMEEWPRQHRITVDEYYRMAEAGLIAEDARVELIDGVIIDMPPIGLPHAAVVNRLTMLFCLAVRERAIVQIQGGVQMGNWSHPQPDLALFNRREDFYFTQRTTAHDTLLVIEVSDSSLAYDRKIKAPMYAQHGVPETWIVDVNAGKVHFFRDPSGGKYREVTSIAPPERVSVPGLPDVFVDLSGLLAA